MEQEKDMPQNEELNKERKRIRIRTIIFTSLITLAIFIILSLYYFTGSRSPQSPPLVTPQQIVTGIELMNYTYSTLHFRYSYDKTAWIPDSIRNEGEVELSDRYPSYFIELCSRTTYFIHCDTFLIQDKGRYIILRNPKGQYEIRNTR